MKKKLLTVCALCLLLAACGREKTTPAETIFMPAIPETETAEASEETLEITMENWQQYFDLRPAAEPIFLEDGTLESWDFFYGVFLREEYAGRFVSGQVDFEIRFDTEHRSASIEEATGTYMLGDLLGESLESDVQQKTFALEDLRQGQSVKSDFYGSIAARAYCGSIRSTQTGELAADLPLHGEILHAEGSLTLQN